MPKRQSVTNAPSRTKHPRLVKQKSKIAIDTAWTKTFVMQFLKQLPGWSREGTLWVHHGVVKTTSVWYYMNDGVVSVETKEGDNVNGWDFYPDNPKAPYVDYNGRNVQSTIFETPEKLLHRFRLILQ